MKNLPTFRTPHFICRALCSAAIASVYAVCLILLSGVAQHANAAADPAHSFNVNFYQFTPSVGPPEDPATLEGPAGGRGQTWNQFNAISGTNLTTASGAPSTFSFTTTANQGRGGENSPLKILKAGISIGNRGTDYTLTLKNLTPGGYYDIWIASGMVDSRPGERDSGNWTTTNPTITVGPQPINCLKSTSSTWVEGNNYVVFKSVQANPGGQIEFLADPSDAGEVDDNAYVLHLNGFQVTPAPPAGIIAFGIPGAAGVINPSAKTIALQVPFATNLASLAPTFVLPSGTCNQKSGAPPSPNFAASKSARYVVTDPTTAPSTVYNYTVTVSVAPPSPTCAMLTADFGTLGLAAIDESAGTVVLTVPKGQPVAAPKFTLSANATIKPLSGSIHNVTKAAVYRVTAENGTVFKDYTVSVKTYANWAHSGSLFIVTTPDGANIAAGNSISDFPMLIRLKSTNFNFAEAQSDGRDLRFTNAAGASLPYQIEQWDPTGGSAAVWVKIPTITGNTTQEIKMYWGNSGATAVSSGASVFNATNGYASVLHMGETLADEVIAKPPTNVNTTAAVGLIGKGRTFAAGQGIACGKIITGLPSGDGPFSTGVWIRSSTASDVLGWGFSTGASKVVMQLASPPSIRMDCWFGAAGVTGKAPIPTSGWNYVVHTYQSGSAKLYVNGVLDTASTRGGPPMVIPPIGSFQIGGWSGAYGFVGEMDEVRISKIARAPEWIRLEYENQKPVQTLVGGLVSSGTAFAVTRSSLKIKEGSSTTFTAQAGGAQKVYWISKKNEVETVLATDQLTLNYTAPRVSNDVSAVIQFKAVFAAGTRTIDVPLTVLNSVPDPVFTLSPSVPQWDGRKTMTVTANVSNLAAMQTAGFGNLNYKWSVSGVAVTKQTSDGTLTLTRSQGSGPMIVSLTMNNGGTPISQSATIPVREPATDPWVQRTPEPNEKAVDKQFFARDPATNLGRLFYCGTQADATDVYLKVFTTDTGSDVPYSTLRQKLVDGAYSFAAPIAAGKVTYKITFGTSKAGVDSAPLATVNDLVCGDAFIIEGQSNAVALQNTAPQDTTTNKWVRTYGLTSGWGYAIKKGPGDMNLGIWGWVLANRLAANHRMPICIINGAVGGTRIDQHRPNPDGHQLPGTLYGIYANLYNRVVGSKLSHGIRGILWHQGEQDQGSDGPDGDYDYKFYQQHFVDISAAWKEDFPNLRDYYLFQIWPGACGDTSRNDQLREVQRTLPRLYSHMQCMSTLGIVPGSACHYDEPGYQVFSDLIGPLVEKDAYGVVPVKSITAPDLQRAYFTTSAKNEIALEFGQEMAWNELAPTMLFLADTTGAPAGIVSSGSATGNIIKLQVPAGSSATTITYVKGLVPWKQTNLLYGTNKIAALTFADGVIGPPPVSPNK